MANPGQYIGGRWTSDIRHDAPKSVAWERGRRDYSDISFEENPFQKSTDQWRDWNLGWRAAQVADPLLDEDEKNYGM